MGDPTPLTPSPEGSSSPSPTPTPTPTLTHPSGAKPSSGGGASGLRLSRSRVSMTSIRSVIEKRRKEQYVERTPLWNSCRLVLALMGFWAFLNVYAMRVNMSVALVCMINHTALRPDASADAASDAKNGYHIRGANVSESLDSGGGGGGGGQRVEWEEKEDRCGDQSGNSSLDDSEDGEFTWSKKTQGLILGSFFWGYMTTQIPGGWLGGRFGGKHVYGLFMLACSVVTLLMPLAARLDYRFLMVLRFLAGVGQGVTFPAMNVLWANWAPPLESSQLGSIGYSGSQVGNVVTFPVAGVLCHYGFDGGWPSIFYLLGGVGIIWWVAWCFLVYNSPAEHPRISPEEKAYITASLKGKMTATREGSGHVPWRALLTSGPVWGIILTHTCSNFGTYTFLTNIPTYLKEVLRLDIKQNGLLSAIPYIGFWLMIIVSGQLADWARSRGYLNTTQARKVGNSLGMLLPGTLVSVMGFMSCEQSTAAVVLLAVGVAFSGCQYGSGWMVNPVDIAPRYAGLIFGISNTMATIPGFLAPMAIGYITKDKTQEQWQIVFFIATAIYVVGAVAYIVLGSGEIQPWAKQDPGQSQDPAIEDPSMGDPLLAEKPADSSAEWTTPKHKASVVSFRNQPRGKDGDGEGEGVGKEEGKGEGGRSSSVDVAEGVNFF
ncbi:hypothetical protein ACOMHN_030499 [Nucella lapillus]